MEEINYRIIRSDRKTVGLEISTGLEVLVRAPRWMPEETINGFVQRHRGWIVGKLEQRRAFLEQRPEPTAEQLSAWSAEASAVIPGRVEHYARVMGLTPAGVRINKNRIRIGSCCGKNRLSFSCRLMGYPAEVLDYVIVHELAHIPHKNHGPTFWRTVEAVLPDYRQRRAMLRG